MNVALTSIIRHKYKATYLLAGVVSNIIGYHRWRASSPRHNRCRQEFWNNVKTCGYLILIMQACFSFPVFANEFRIITFDYPPYTYGDGRDGLAIVNIKQAFKKAGHSVNVEYYPVARAFQYFLMDKEALFAGHISQFAQQQDLGYVNNINATHRFLVRRDFEGSITNAKGLAVLRDDQNGISYAQKWHLEVHTVDNNEQSTEMLLAGRIDLLSCIGIECNTILANTGERLRILDGSEEEFYVHIVFHRNTNSERVLTLIKSMGWLKQQ